MVHPTRDAVWSFQTREFFVGFYAEPEEMGPEDSFEFQEDIDAVNNGEVEWFSAAVRVYFKNGSEHEYNWIEIGSDHLGGCAYRTIREFYTAHRDPDPLNRNSSIMHAAKGDNVVICHYFPDMVRLAVKDARKQVRRFKCAELRK
jgi:hypothetical protein